MIKLINSDVMDGLKSLPDASVHTVCTSPPYWALRDYGLPPKTWDDGWIGVLGQEPSIHLFIQHLVEIFEEAKRVLHPTGTLWLNLGNSYAHAGPQPSTGIHKRNAVPLPNDYKREKLFQSKKQLSMLPARVALAMQDAGWVLRSEIVWAKGLSFCDTYSGSVMPESIRDRPCSAHEMVYLFSKQDAYYYDIEGCREPYAESTLKQAKDGYDGLATKDYDTALAQNPSDTKRRIIQAVRRRQEQGLTPGGASERRYTGFNDQYNRNPPAGVGRNLRDVWVIPKEPLKESHFAAWPTKLVEPMIRLGTSDYGVCPQCATPWTRNLVKEPVPADIQQQFEAARVATTRDTGRTDGHTQRKPNYRRKVLGEGWLPGCSCEQNEPVPATVLDPFAGSSRTGVVAQRLGRNYIGIDANPSYCKIGEKLLGLETHAEREDSGSGPVEMSGAPAGGQ